MVRRQLGAWVAIIAGVGVAIGSGGTYLFSKKPTSAQKAEFSTQSASTVASATAVPDIDFAEIVGLQIPFLESKLGPARTASGNEKSYRINGCDFSIIAANGAVQSVMVPNTDACALPRDQLLRSQNIQAGNLTFGAFTKARRLSAFYSDCIYMCGNSVDPTVYLVSGGSHADIWIEVMVGVSLVSGPALDAADRIESAMKVEGDDYLLDTRFNCDHKFDDVAAKALAQVRVDTIEVGTDLRPGLTCNAQ